MNTELESAQFLNDFFSRLFNKTLFNRTIQFKSINRYLYEHNNSFLIQKRIGSDSKTACIYLCQKDDHRILPFVHKKYKDPLKQNAFNDINMSIRLTRLVIENINPHFNITYKYYNKGLLAELASGDLISFLKGYKKYNIIANCLQQILLCILSFHIHTELIHNDCYHGNFLFHKITPGGHIHYQINKQNIYIENLGYLWVINDFDMISEVPKNNEYINDYSQAMEAFVNYKKCKTFNKIVRHIVFMLSEMTENFNDYDFFHRIFEETSLYNLQVNKGELINQIINKHPYTL